VSNVDDILDDFLFDLFKHADGFAVSYYFFFLVEIVSILLDFIGNVKLVFLVNTILIEEYFESIIEFLVVLFSYLSNLYLANPFHFIIGFD